MISVLNRGSYTLFETKQHTNMLTLDKKETYAWVHLQNKSEILVTSYVLHTIDHMLSIGNYRLYKVENEPGLTDQIHLELSIGQGMWQGYLLPNGLPSEKKKKNRVIPTHECITTTEEAYSPTLASYAQ